MKTARPACLIAVINLLSVALFLSHYLSRAYPMIGHDFAYFMPRFLDTHLHHLVNGLEIQWYTPSFGGGLPVFPNPQDLQFSLPQYLLFLMDPWRAIVLSVVLFAFAGYLSCYVLLRQTVGLSWQASTLGALFFTVNGFYLNHMTAGHVGYLTYPLLPLLLISMLDERISVLLGALIASLVISSLIYSAGFYLLVVFVFSVMVTLPIIALIRPGLFKVKRFFLTAVFAIPLTLGLTASKIYAVQSFMRLFPREVADHYKSGFLAGIDGVIFQLSGVTVVWPPLRLLLRKAPDAIQGALSVLTGAPYGIWELDTSLSAILLCAVAAGVIVQFMAMRKRRQWPTRRQWTLLILLAAGSWVIVDFATARGAIYDATKSLPIVRSLHVNVRFTAAFILPLVVTGAYFLERAITRLQMGNRTFLAVNLAAILSLGAYYLLPAQLHNRSFDVSGTLQTYKLVEQGERFTITRISAVTDAETFMRRASSLKPYEPLFGYGRENFSANTVEGDVFSQRGKYLNMTDPTSLVFPHSTTAPPFERIKAADISKLRAFVERRQADWKIPSLLEWLVRLALFTVLIQGAVLLGLAWRYIAGRFGTDMAAPDGVSQTR